MFAKVCVLILCVGVSASALLVLRQQRLVAVHRMAQVQRQIAQADRDLMTLRVRLAQAISVGRVERMAAALGPLRPIGVDPPDQGEGGAGGVGYAAVEGGDQGPRRR